MAFGTPGVGQATSRRHVTGDVLRLSRGSVHAEEQQQGEDKGADQAEANQVGARHLPTFRMPSPDWRTQSSIVPAAKGR
jgi:hypothetical protein